MRPVSTIVSAWLCAPVFLLLAAAQAAAVQVLEGADHAELAAEVSSGVVNRIALENDRISRVVQSPQAFTVEHDPVEGDVYLYPAAETGRGLPVLPGAGADTGAAAPARVTLYIGTERGFTYRLSLTAADRDSAQILIRNAAAGNGRDGPALDGAAGGPANYRQTLAALVGAAARGEPPRGYSIEVAPLAPGVSEDDEDASQGVRRIETWRGPRLTVHVLRLKAEYAADAEELAKSYGQNTAAAWLGAARSSPADGSPAGSRPEDSPVPDGGAAREIRGVVVVENSAAESAR